MFKIQTQKLLLFPFLYLILSLQSWTRPFQEKILKISDLEYVNLKFKDLPIAVQTDFDSVFQTLRRRNYIGSYLNLDTAFVTLKYDYHNFYLDSIPIEMPHNYGKTVHLPPYIFYQGYLYCLGFDIFQENKHKDLYEVHRFDLKEHIDYMGYYSMTDNSKFKQHKKHLFDLYKIFYVGIVLLSVYFIYNLGVSKKKIAKRIYVPSVLIIGFCISSSLLLQHQSYLLNKKTILLTETDWIGKSKEKIIQTIGKPEIEDQNSISYLYGKRCMDGKIGYMTFLFNKDKIIQTKIDCNPPTLKTLESLD